MFKYSSIFRYFPVNPTNLFLLFLSFLCDNESKYLDWLKTQSLHDISNLDKFNWYFSLLIDKIIIIIVIIKMFNFLFKGILRPIFCVDINAHSVKEGKIV